MNPSLGKPDPKVLILIYLCLENKNKHSTKYVLLNWKSKIGFLKNTPIIILESHT